MTGATDRIPGVEPWAPDASLSPPSDPTLEPAGYVVGGDRDVRLHFLDWGGPAHVVGLGDPGVPGVLLLPGILQPAWSWAPVARRLARTRRTVVADLRGQGLSDAPMEGYDPASLAADAVAVAEGSGLLQAGPIVVAGHGFGGVVAAAAAARLGPRCAGLALVDGGWERLEETTGVDVDEFLRGLDEPPEVLRSMDAWLADRRGFDPATWDEDQRRAALDAVVETAAGHVVRAVRPHVVEALVRTMFAWDPAPVLATVGAAVTALLAREAGDPAPRLAELGRSASARAAEGGSPIRLVELAGAHNVMRYHAAAVAASILGTAR